MTMPAEFQYDVFLSHSAKDKAVVRPLAERLRQDGLKVWLVPAKRLREDGVDEWLLPVAAARQSAANFSAGQVQEEEDGGALPRRRYGKI